MFVVTTEMWMVFLGRRFLVSLRRGTSWGAIVASSQRPAVPGWCYGAFPVPVLSHRQTLPH